MISEKDFTGGGAGESGMCIFLLNTKIILLVRESSEIMIKWMFHPEKNYIFSLAFVFFQFAANPLT